MFGSNIDNLNDFMSVDEAHSVPHKYMKLENAEVELDCSIPIEKVRPSSTKKASTAHQKSIKNHDKEITRQGKIIDSIWYETKINARFRANHIQHCGQTLNEHARRMLDEGKEIYSY